MDISNKKSDAHTENAIYEYNVDPSKLIGYKQITGHMILDVRMGKNLCCKAIFVSDIHNNKTPRSITYSTVVSQDSERICVTIAALNDIHVLSADTENAYLSAPCCEQVWMRIGPEFGNYEGKVLIIRKAFYGPKSSGTAFQYF